MIRTLLITISLFATVPTSAFAGYINNKADWNRLDDRYSYAMGIYDGLAVNTGDSPEDSAYIVGWQRCLQANNITSVELVEMIDQGYAEDVANWSLPPLSMMLKGLSRLCETEINVARREFGLEPLQ